MSNPQIGDITVVEIVDPEKLFEGIEYRPDYRPMPEIDRSLYQHYTKVLQATTIARNERKIGTLEFVNERLLAQFCFKHKYTLVPSMTAERALDMAIELDSNRAVSEQWLELAGYLEKRALYTYRAW